MDMKSLSSLGPVSTADRNKYYAIVQKIADEIDIIKAAYWRVGSMLKDIREEALWRIEFKSFDEFCKIKCRTSRRHVNYIIKAYEGFVQLQKQGVEANFLPNTERLMREVLMFPPDIRKKLLQNIQRRMLAEGKPKMEIADIHAAAREMAISIEGPTGLARLEQIDELTKHYEAIERSMKKNRSIAWQELSAQQANRIEYSLAAIKYIADLLLKAKQALRSNESEEKFEQ